MLSALYLYRLISIKESSSISVVITEMNKRNKYSEIVADKSIVRFKNERMQCILHKMKNVNLA